MPVTWCYQVLATQGGEDQYCATGFPMGCYVDEKGNQKDACVISRDYNKADHYYIFNHVDITITYHSGKAEDWGKYFTAEEIGGRIVSGKVAVTYSYTVSFKENNDIRWSSRWDYILDSMP